MEEIEDVGELGEGDRVASDSIRTLEKVNIIWSQYWMKRCKRLYSVQRFFCSRRLLATREQDITNSAPYPSLWYVSVSRAGEK